MDGPSNEQQMRASEGRGPGGGKNNRRNNKGKRTELMGPAAGCSLIDQLLLSDPIGMSPSIERSKIMMLDSRQKFLFAFFAPPLYSLRTVYYSSTTHTPPSSEKVCRTVFLTSNYCTSVLPSLPETHTHNPVTHSPPPKKPKFNPGSSPVCK